MKVLHRRLDTARLYENLKTISRTCQSSHELCRVAPVGFVPSRLLEVSPDSGKNHIRLVETTSDRQWSWACLSYVWGGEQRAKTTRTRLPGYLKKMHLTRLPQTIKDAVAVCRELGIPFLWIDSFCIVQDDESDKAREIPQMALIYRHSLLTISAACAHSVEEGFLHHVRPLCYRRFAPTSLRYRDLSGSEIRALALMEGTPLPIMHDSKQPIDARAWTLQERLLSPRLLSYTSYGPLWSCRSLNQLADEHDFTIRTHGNSISHHELEAREPVPCIPGMELEPWDHIVVLYADRQATLPSDRLVALSAVAQTYSESSHEYGAYLAGLWEKSLPESLMWVVPADHLLPRPSEYVAPSWSWASVSGGVRYKWIHSASVKYDADLQVIEARSNVIGNIFGAVRDGTLVLDAKVRDCRVRKLSCEDASMPTWSYDVVDVPETEIDADTTDFWSSISAEGTEVTLLYAGIHTVFGKFGLVLDENIDGTSLRRVAHFCSNNCHEQEDLTQAYDEFFDKFVMRRVTIT